jgi:ribosomal protein S18 acetylase RimI-like enzyme
MTDSPIACRTRLIRILYAMEQGSGMGLVVCDVQDQALGYGQWLRHQDYAEISDLYIMQTERGKGLGTALIQHLTRSAAGKRSQIQIAVDQDNLSALRLYLALGFRHYTSLHDILYLRLSC